ncbi:hypothetical protein ACFX1R_019482 [Malus domestica]
MKQAVWLRNFVAEMKIVDSVKRLLKMFFREIVKKREIEIVYLSTENMIADPLTKALPNNAFKAHVTRMGVLEAFDKWE